jgi:hypothetical protein
MVLVFEGSMPEQTRHYSCDFFNIINHRYQGHQAELADKGQICTIISLIKKICAGPFSIPG